MDRRKFLSLIVGGVAATAAVRTFPFRVYSFPSKPAVPFTGGSLFQTPLVYDHLTPDNFFLDTPWLAVLRTANMPFGLKPSDVSVFRHSRRSTIFERMNDATFRTLHPRRV